MFVKQSLFVMSTLQVWNLVNVISNSCKFIAHHCTETNEPEVMVDILMVVWSLLYSLVYEAWEVLLVLVVMTSLSQAYYNYVHCCYEKRKRHHKPCSCSDSCSSESSSSSEEHSHSLDK
ncbi:hypothetical protein BgiMline_033670 [Biomphalaria glabrata]|nr:hypothetical protein BgiMline_024754 [Biomphalaria glabrata]